MNVYETLEFLSRLVVLATNVIVAAVCFERYRAWRWPAFLLLAISGSLAVFSEFSGLLLQRRVSDESAYALVWSGIMLLNLLDMVLYATGVVMLVKRLQPIGRALPGPESHADES